MFIYFFLFLSFFLPYLPPLPFLSPSLFSSLSLHPPFFSLFLFSPCKLNCCALLAVLPSWQSVQAQFYRLSISQLCFYLVNITFGFPCSPSQSPVLFSLEYFGYNCMCGSVCICPIISVITCLICLISSHWNTGTSHP